MAEALIYATQAIFVACLVFAGQRLMARSSKQANEKTAEVQEKSDAVDGYHQLVKDLQSDVARLRNDHDTLQKEHNSLRQHVTTLENERRRDKSLIRALWAHIQALRASMREAKLPIPEAPAGIDFDAPPLT